MDQEETIKLLQEENRKLKREIEKLLEYTEELEARLAQYENAHTPPSLKRDCNRWS
jgi:transposase